MRTREEFIEKLKDDLDRWNAYAAAWEVKTRSASEEARAACEKRMAEFRAARARNLRSLRELRASSDRAWNEMSQGAEDAWQRMRQAYEQARLHFDR